MEKRRNYLTIGYVEVMHNNKSYFLSFKILVERKLNHGKENKQDTSAKQWKIILMRDREKSG